MHTYYTPSYLEFLTLHNITGFDYTYGIYLYDVTTSVNNCTFTDLDCWDYKTYGIYTSYTLNDLADVQMTRLNSSYYTYGIYISSSNANIHRVNISGLDGYYISDGIYLDNNYIIVKDCRIFDCHNNNDLYGVKTDSSGLIDNLIVEDCWTRDYLYGFYGDYYDETTIQNSVVRRITSDVNSREICGFRGGNQKN